MKFNQRDFMTRFRIIPTLLLNGAGLYKGKKFKDHIYVGDPINTIKLFNDKEVDEIILLDIKASVNKQKPNFPLIQEICSEAFVPVAYGGGIKTLEDAIKVIQCGVEKVILNSVLYENINIIRQIAQIYGSQSIVVSIDLRKNFLGKYVLYSHSGKVKENLILTDLIKTVINLGCGEILINCVDRDGLKDGFDLKILDTIMSVTNVPIIIGCGLGEDKHILEAYQCGVNAVAGGSYFLFQGKFNAVLISYPNKNDMFKWVK